MSSALLPAAPAIPDSAALAALTPAQLTRAMAATDAESNAICDAMIAAGRGHELAWDTLKLTDPLALRYRANAARHSALYGERERRMTYHGSLRRIPVRSL